MKRLILFILAFNFILPTLLHAQAPDTLWTRTYGIPDRINECWDAVEAAYGGLAIAGTSTEQGYMSHLYVIRIDSDGDTLWTKTFGDGTGGQAISQTLDYGFIVAGYDALSAGHPLIIKIDSSGNEIWSRVYTSLLYGFPRSVQPVGNDGYILAGYIASNILLLRINSNGDTLWSRTYGGSNMEKAWSVKPTADSGFIVIGWTESYGNGGSDFYIIKTDSNGDSIWTRTYGHQGDDEAREIIEIPNEGFIFTGKRTEEGSPYYHLMKTDQWGDSVWAYNYHGSNPGFFKIMHSFTQTQNGGFALTGYCRNTITDVEMIKTNSEGDSLWSISYIDDPIINGPCRSILQSSDGSYFLCGNNDQDIWVVKLDAEQTGIEDDFTPQPDRITLDQNYPNPFNANTTISFTLAEAQDINLTVYDLLGRKVEVLLDGMTNAGTHQVHFIANDYPSGLYFYRLAAGNYSDARMMVLLK